jgi:hypothetical protein
MTEEDSDDARNGFHFPVLKGDDGGKTIIAYLREQPTFFHLMFHSAGSLLTFFGVHGNNANKVQLCNISAF